MGSGSSVPIKMPTDGAHLHAFSSLNNGKLDDFYQVETTKLGEGAYGSVWKAVHKSTNALRAIKAIDRRKITDGERFETEVDIQCALDHPNIVQLYEVFVDAMKVYLVMELCNGGQLFDRIMEEAEKNGGNAFDERGAATYMQQILGAMSYLHKNDFVHRDVKPENLLLQSRDPDAPVKVIDFGCAREYKVGSGRTMRKIPTKVTPYYVAPEILQERYDEKCDVWGCGVICYILLCGYPPFFGETDGDILQMVKKGAFTFPSQDWDGTSPEAKECISQMLTLNATNRPSAAKMLEHRWLDKNAEAPKGKPPNDLCGNLKKFNEGSRMKKVALTLIAQQLKNEDLEQLRSAFLVLDKNKDGTLSIEEIQKGMADSALEIPPDLIEIMKNLDGSGRIDYTEFIAATLSQKQYLQKEVLWSAFRVFDKDGTGKITKQELGAILKEQADGEAIRDMVSEVDLGGDGEISFDEFVTLMEKGVVLK
ncbi:unnamed protein product [Effrenium voratum]|uniref:non-specific serine/threonine protein kinase n=1 Tax=Effrenium voratum TaxID=2562239 RepID=A0AA36ILN6_9DINO|nr:unnamed protein product [Effrenium voratum]CAJ1389713.1 unnamed protein product [Effrenium voratum]CAJ1417623.1 unnamed protein product [Effrenium voratum]